ncbi:N-acetyltransferase [Lysinibacillus sp. SGAir0095]|uniref:GNAT family N-acetyltransferase n=1 Tax=Lysinibacillus sp. SGAir0095 TaxID=2070463 RepID=UPI0010CD5F3C|nr:GNAT family N-acetyltransferase [Lysinibacillus sp. SGAir0095]QCR31288.1 hypothetical protein C1N55_03550 [Lysinibacillus sp. SGAir0095]
MTVVIERAKDFRELAHFLTELNNQKAFHIGYCGHKVEEIYETLKADFVREGQSTVLVAKNSKEKIEAAIGLDIDEESAEVWGPYNRNTSINIQSLVWESLLQEYPTIETFYFFLNKENLKQQEFMKTIHATKTGEYLILEIKKHTFQVVNELKSTPYIQSDFDAFAMMHGQAFPNTYYNAETIVSRLNEACILKILKSESNEILGYAYYEVDSLIEEATLHYFAISPMTQNQGYGTTLLKEVITEIFSFSEISEVKLCVDHTNAQANHVYFKVGFEEKDVLYSYRLNRNATVNKFI